MLLAGKPIVDNIHNTSTAIINSVNGTLQTRHTTDKGNMYTYFILYTGEVKPI